MEVLWCGGFPMTKKPAWHLFPHWGKPLENVTTVLTPLRMQLGTYHTLMSQTCHWKGVRFCTSHIVGLRFVSYWICDHKVPLWRSCKQQLLAALACCCYFVINVFRGRLWLYSLCKEQSYVIRSLIIFILGRINLTSHIDSYFFRLSNNLYYGSNQPNFSYC